MEPVCKELLEHYPLGHLVGFYHAGEDLGVGEVEDQVVLGYGGFGVDITRGADQDLVEFTLEQVAYFGLVLDDAAQESSSKVHGVLLFYVVAEVGGQCSLEMKNHFNEILALFL